jgi:Uncharacterised methyltransferase family (DUF6094)
MRPHGKTKLGFFPLPVPEAQRLKKCLDFPEEFSGLDPCLGDGIAFTHLLEGTKARRYGIEIDANRAEQAARLGIDMGCTPMPSMCAARLSLYHFSISILRMTSKPARSNSQRLELVFLEHTYRWLKPGGILLFVVPQPQLKPSARILSEHFTDLSVLKLTEPASAQYKQIVVLGVRRKRNQLQRDSALLDFERWLKMLASKPDIEILGDVSHGATRFQLPGRQCSRTWEFRSTKSRICCSIQQPIARPAACFFPNSATFAGGL